MAEPARSVIDGVSAGWPASGSLNTVAAAAIYAVVVWFLGAVFARRRTGRSRDAGLPAA